MSNLKSMTNEYLETLIEEQRAGYTGKFQPFDAYKSQVLQGLNQIAENYQNSIRSGYQILLRNVKSPQDSFIIKNEKLSEGTFETVQERMGFSLEILREIYEVSVNLFNEKKYKDARHVLSYLLFLNPYVTTFWIALGQVFEAEQDQATALECYKLATFADPEDRRGYDQAVRCCIDLEKWSDAETLLSAGIEVLHGSHHQGTEKHLKQLKGLVNRQKGGE